MSTPASSTALISAGGPADRDLTEELRAAICSEAYEDVIGLLAEYRQQIERELRAVSGNPATAKHVVTEANNLFVWARNTVSANRAHAQAKLSQLSQAAGYGSANRSRSRTWLLEG